MSIFYISDIIYEISRFISDDDFFKITSISKCFNNCINKKQLNNYYNIEKAIMRPDLYITKIHINLKSLTFDSNIFYEKTLDYLPDLLEVIIFNNMDTQIIKNTNKLPHALKYIESWSNRYSKNDLKQLYPNLKL
jgi:hypothetical protein